MNSRTATLIVILGLGMACSPPDDQRTDSIDPATAGRSLPAEAMAQLDSGNAAYRMETYEAALRHYIRVTNLVPDDASGWFGIFMAHTALGNAAAADSALARARGVAPGATLIHTGPGDTLTDGGGRP